MGKTSLMLKDATSQADEGESMSQSRAEQIKKIVGRIHFKYQETSKMKKRKTTLLVGALIALALVAAACNKAGSSPTATAQAFYEAAKSKDVSAMKSLLSKNTLDMMDKIAKAQSKSVEDLLKASNEGAPPPATFETRNEKIDGDKATVEVNQDGKGKWQTVTFVKEDGQWKLDH